MCSIPPQLNHSLKPRPQVTLCLEDSLKVPPPPVVTTIVRMQRQPTWQQRPSSTCLLAAGRDQRLSKLTPGRPAPRYVGFVLNSIKSFHTASSNLYQLCRSQILKWMKMGPWTSAWKKTRGMTCSLQSRRPPHLHPLSMLEPARLRATLSLIGTGHWTSPKEAESKKKIMKRCCTWYRGGMSHATSRAGYLCFYLSPGGVYSTLIHFIWWWGRGPGELGGQEVPRWGHHQHLQGQIPTQRQQKRNSCVSLPHVHPNLSKVLPFTAYKRQLSSMRDVRWRR